MTLIIKDFNELFETSDSKRYLRLKWIALPVKQDGSAYRRIASLKNGPEIFAAWILMLQLASKKPLGSRGILKNDNGTDMTPEDMHFATGFPEEIFKLAIPVLKDHKIGWIHDDSQESLVDKRSSTGKPRLHNITEHNKTKEVNPNSESIPPSITEVKEYCKEHKSVDAETFWHHYNARGWVLNNKQKMKSWKSAITTWEKRDFNNKPPEIVPKKEYLN